MTTTAKFNPFEILLNTSNLYLKSEGDEVFLLSNDDGLSIVFPTLEDEIRITDKIISSCKVTGHNSFEFKVQEDQYNFQKGHIVEVVVFILQAPNLFPVSQKEYKLSPIFTN